MDEHNHCEVCGRPGSCDCEELGQQDWEGWARYSAPVSVAAPRWPMPGDLFQHTRTGRVYKAGMLHHFPSGAIVDAAGPKGEYLDSVGVEHIQRPAFTACFVSGYDSVGRACIGLMPVDVGGQYGPHDRGQAQSLADIAGLLPRLEHPPEAIALGPVDMAARAMAYLTDAWGEWAVKAGVELTIGASVWVKHAFFEHAELFHG